MSLPRNEPAPLQLELAGVEGPDEIHVHLEPPPRTYGECEGKQARCEKACRHNTGIALGRERAGRRWKQGRRILPLWNPALAGCALHYAEKGGMELWAVGRALGISGEAVRLTIVKLVAKLRESGQAEDLIDAITGGASK
jgi:hypothetical protein